MMAGMKQVTDWMWRTDDGVHGVSLDVKAGTLTWHDLLGCHCYDLDGVEQDVSAFLEEGPPPTAGWPPDEIRAEMEAALAEWR